MIDVNDAIRVLQASAQPDSWNVDSVYVDIAARKLRYLEAGISADVIIDHGENHPFDDSTCCEVGNLSNGRLRTLSSD